MERTCRRYSEAFKLQIVSQLESGELKSIWEAKERYGITGALTVSGWLRKYGKNHLIRKAVRVEMPEETDQLKQLKKENDQLKKALAQTHMKSLLYESWFEIACRDLGVTDLEAYKKKLEGGPSR